MLSERLSAFQAVSDDPKKKNSCFRHVETT